MYTQIITVVFQNNSAFIAFMHEQWITLILLSCCIAYMDIFLHFSQNLRLFMGLYFHNIYCVD